MQGPSAIPNTSPRTSAASNPRLRIPTCPGPDQGIGQGPVRQQLIFYLLAQLLPLRFGDLLLQLQQAAYQAGPPLLHEQLTQPLGRLYHDLAHQAAGIGTPEVAGAKVMAEVVAEFRAPKVVAFKKKRRKGYHRKVGHRQDLLKVKIASIA